MNQGKLYSVSLDCVGYELSSRAVASQVLSPLQRLTSVFGMGTGGPTALKTLTLHRATLSRFPIILSRISPCRTFVRRCSSHYTIEVGIGDLLCLSSTFGCKHCLLVHLRGLEPRTH